jgi:YVTN family beta-propeller protein/cysteine-rich repeat protein
METDTIAGGGFGEVIVDPTGTLVYAVDETFPGLRDEIIVSDTATNTVVDSESFPGCTGLRGLTFDATGATLYASCGGTNEVAVIDTATLTAVEVPVGFVPSGTSITPDGALLYVANAGSNDVSVIDTATNTVVDTIAVGDEPTSYGTFIGPNFVCGNSTIEPGEGCDDGNVAGGDGCSSNCYNERESIISPVKPVSFRIPSGNTAGSATVKVKIRNGSDTTQSIAVLPTTSCAGGYTYSNLGTQFINQPVSVEPGKTAKGIVTVGIINNPNFQLNALAPIRCTYTLTATAQPNEFTVDLTPSNNVALLEVDIFDDNQPDMSTVHETKILPIKPVKMKIKPGAASASKTVKFKVGSADYLPSPEPASSHSVSVTGADATCPPLTVGPATIGGSASAGVEGGDTESGEVTVTIAAADVSSPSKTTPARCAATLTAVGPPGDSMSSNDTANIVIDISDLNDF